MASVDAYQLTFFWTIVTGSGTWINMNEVPRFNTLPAFCEYVEALTAQQEPLWQSPELLVRITSTFQENLPLFEACYDKESSARFLKDISAFCEKLHKDENDFPDPYNFEAPPVFVPVDEGKFHELVLLFDNYCARSHAKSLLPKEVRMKILDDSLPNPFGDNSPFESGYYPDFVIEALASCRDLLGTGEAFYMSLIDWINRTKAPLKAIQKILSEDEWSTLMSDRFASHFRALNLESMRFSEEELGTLLARYPQITFLSIGGMIGEIQKIYNLPPQLETLDCSYTRCWDLELPESLKEFHCCSGHDVLCPWESLPEGLEVLDCKKSNIELRLIPTENLRELYMSGAKQFDETFSKPFKKLEILDVSGTCIDHFEEGILPKTLKKLVWEKCRIEHLKNLPESLSELYLNLSGVSPLVKKKEYFNFVPKDCCIYFSSDSWGTRLDFLDGD